MERVDEANVEICILYMVQYNSLFQRAGPLRGMLAGKLYKYKYSINILTLWLVQFYKISSQLVCLAGRAGGDDLLFLVIASTVQHFNGSISLCHPSAAAES